MEHFTKDDLLKEIRKVCIEFADSLERVLYPGVSMRVLGLDPAMYPAKSQYGGPFTAADLEESQLDPHKLSLIHI